MRRYPKYRSTGVPWLEHVPEHWEFRRSKSVFRTLDIRSTEGKEELLSVSEKNGVALRKNTNVTMFQAASYAGYKLCWPNDLVINSLWAWMTGLGISKYHGIISTAYSVFRIWNQGKFDSHYGNYLLRSKAYNWEFRVRSKGIWRSRYQLADDSFLSMPLLIPPLHEQQQISRYLDWQIGIISKFIKAKKKLIALLKEQKQNIINEAVAKGINPSVEMKDSGVVWIRDIPEHWQSVRLKHCVSSIDQGWSPQCEAQPAEANEWGVLKVGCVNGDHFNSLQNKKLPDGLAPRLQCRIQENDIVVSRANTRELVGLAAIIDKSYPNILLCDKLYRFTARKDVAIASFLVYSIRCSASREQIEERATGASSSMQNISQSVIRNLLIPLPPLDEQQSIVDFINQETALIDKTIARTEREIELIQEYRTRLVSDVVTGGVDVRSIEIPDFEPAPADLEVQDDEESEDELITEGIEE